MTADRSQKYEHPEEKVSSGILESSGMMKLGTDFAKTGIQFGHLPSSPKTCHIVTSTRMADLLRLMRVLQCT